MTAAGHQSRAGGVLKGLWALLHDAGAGWLKHQASRTGAALAFYTVFSLGPVLILSIAIAGFFFGESAARGEIVGQIEDLIGRQGAQAIQAVLQNASRPGAGFIPTIISVVTLILGANTALADVVSRQHREISPVASQKPAMANTSSLFSVNRCGRFPAFVHS